MIRRVLIKAADPDTFCRRVDQYHEDGYRIVPGTTYTHALERVAFIGEEPTTKSLTVFDRVFFVEMELETP